MGNNVNNRYFNVNRSIKKYSPNLSMHLNKTVDDLTKNLKKWEIKKRYR
jgi:hypothetical protein